MSTVVDKSSILLYVNNIKAGCSTNCVYETNSLKVPKIMSFTMTGNELSTTVSTVNGLTLDNTKLKVEYGE